jgi:hypothetical protein
MSEIERRAKELYYLHSTVWQERRLKWEQRTDEAQAHWLKLAATYPSEGHA